MGIHVSGPSFLYGDNMAVVQNTSWPETVVKNKSNSVYYHAVHEPVAMGKSLVGQIPSKENIIDLMFNVVYGERRNYLVSNVLYDIHDEN